jgi:hypothetical protein
MTNPFAPPSRSDKTRTTFYWKRRFGEPTGRLAPGFKKKWHDDRYIVVIDEQLAPFIRRAFRLAAEGYSLRRVKFALEYEFSPLPLKKPLTRTVLKSVLHNPTYAEWHFVEAGDRCVTIVNPMLFNRVQERMKGNRKR